MHFLVLLVLHDMTRLESILTSWESAGVSGVTVIPTTGLGRIRGKFALRDDLPLIPSLNDLLVGAHEEISNRAVFSIVENEALVDALVKATEDVLGDMDQPRNGILAVLPVARVHGLSHKWKDKKTNEDSGR